MKSDRPRLETLAVFLLLITLGYATADLTILSFREKLLPSEAPAVRPARPRMPQYVGRERYQPIANRNIFSSDQKIPDPLGGAKDGKQDQNLPVPTQLPIQLVGTLVHSNPARSVATLSLKNKNEVIAIRVEGELPDGMGTIKSIERAKVVFRNNGSGRLEYVELKDESTVSFSISSHQQEVAPGIIATSESDRTIKRDDLNRYLADLPAILGQARAVPRIGPNGNVECFNIAEMQAGSVFESLGVRRGDCIETVNGEKIDSPAKAMELFQSLRGNASTINLGFERGGRKETSNFTIQ